MSKKPRVAHSAEELKEHLCESIQMLQGTARAYDEGQEYMAKMLAVQIRVLVHDRGSSHSLLRTLNLVAQDAKYNKQNIQFYNTCMDVNPRNLLPHDFFVSVEFTNDSVRHVPSFDSMVPMCQVKQEGFEDWWSVRPIFIDSHKNKFTRSDLVLSLSNQAGGAHVDPAIDEEYYQLTRQHSMGWVSGYIKKGVKSEKVGLDNQIGYPAVRQITHELLKTLYDVAPECFPKPYAAPTK